MKSRHLIRALLSRFLIPHGYRISGNHIFTLSDFAAITSGVFRLGVLECPERHPARIVRAAELLARTY